MEASLYKTPVPLPAPGSPVSSHHFLVVCLDAGGTVPPAMALAQALVVRGHRVSVLSQPSVQQRARSVGCNFLPFSGVPDFEKDRVLEEQLETTMSALGPSPGEDLVSIVKEQGVDLIIIDADLVGCLATTEAFRIPSAEAWSEPASPGCGTDGPNKSFTRPEGEPVPPSPVRLTAARPCLSCAGSRFQGRYRELRRERPRALLSTETELLTSIPGSLC